MPWIILPSRPGGWLLPVRVWPAPGAARMSSPSCGIAQWLSTVQYVPVLADFSWSTGYREPGGSGPGVGVSRVPWREQGPADSRRRLLRLPGAPAARGSPRGATARRPRFPEPGGYERTSRHSWRGPPPHLCDRPVDTPHSDLQPEAHGPPLSPWRCPAPQPAAATGRPQEHVLTVYRHTLKLRRRRETRSRWQPPGTGQGHVREQR